MSDTIFAYMSDTIFAYISETVFAYESVAIIGGDWRNTHLRHASLYLPTAIIWFLMRTKIQEIHIEVVFNPISGLAQYLSTPIAIYSISYKQRRYLISYLQLVISPPWFPERNKNSRFWSILFPDNVLRLHCRKFFW